MSNGLIYYSVQDNFPPYRVDVADLFDELKSQGHLDTEWYMARSVAGLGTAASFNHQIVHLPPKLNSQMALVKLLNKILYWTFDLLNLVATSFRKIQLYQTRDKYIASLFALFIARLKGAKFTYWCSYPFPEHDLDEVKRAKGLRRLVRLIYGYCGYIVLYKMLIPWSDHTFVQSQQMLEDIAGYGVKAEKMTPIPMGVPRRIWSIDTSNIELVKQRLVYVGTFAAVRKLEVLIEAFAIVHRHFPAASLVMVGDGTLPSERIALENKVKALGLSVSVQFTGFVPMARAWEVAASAEVCISPFYPTKVLASTSPTKLVEYMALGRPVVCNDHPEQSRIIADTGCGLCVNWGKQAFADAVMWMYEHPEQAREMGKKGIEWVKKHRTYTTIAQQTWQVYQSILAN